jgi:DNA recombination protein RmuC
MTYTLVVFLVLIAGLLGAALSYFILKSKMGISIAVLAEQKEKLATQFTQSEANLAQWVAKSEQSIAQLATAQNEIKNLEIKLSEERAQLAKMGEQLQKDFNLLANKILEEKSQKFVEKNDQQLRSILEPLKDRITEYEKKVTETHRHADIERASMKEQLRQMTEMNARMSQDALNLTKALKGDAKTQGNWGELILEKILEKSGLTKGREYSVQQSFVSEDGNRLMPDVVINLPEDKHIIIDSKVSLVAYERFVSSEDDIERAQFLKEHQLSLRAHIKNLSGKAYHQLYQINSPDFVLLFVPIESAFALAVKDNEEIYNEAFDKNIIIVSTSTLLATLRTISNIWDQEKQTQNALEIAKKGADLYDKFVGFTEDLIMVGKRLNESTTAYQGAMNKLTDGNGNLIKRVEDFKKLGLKTSKAISQALVDRADKDSLDV